MQGRQRHLYCSLLLAALVVVQLRAQLVQLEHGFRPFSRAPTRVAFSWDMFAIRIARCVVTWSPPIEVEGNGVARWQDRTAPLEFDAVYDDVFRYEVAAKAGCSQRTAARTVASLVCLTSDGGVDEHTIDCP